VVVTLTVKDSSGKILLNRPVQFYRWHLTSFICHIDEFCWEYNGRKAKGQDQAKLDTAAPPAVQAGAVQAPGWRSILMRLFQ